MQEFQRLPTEELIADRNDRDNWNHVKNLDDFFKNMYEYYDSKGLPAIILVQCTSLVCLAFTIILSTFLIGFVDWPGLANCHDEDSCQNVKSPFSWDPFHATPSFYKLCVVVYFILLIILFVYRCFESLNKVNDAVEMDTIYRETLGLKPTDLRDMEWYQIVQRLIDLHAHGTFRVTVKEKLTVHDVVLRIMRRDNYLVGLINKNCLDLTVPWWITPVISDQLFLTTSLEWALGYCITNCMFDDQFDLSTDFLNDVSGLKWKFQAVGLIHLMLLPFMLIYMSADFFLQNAQQFHSTRSYLGAKQWSPLALWQFREFNELPHIFAERINKSNGYANDYLNSFINPYYTICAKTLAFMAGALLAALLLVSVISDGALLFVSVGDHNLLWYLGIISAVYAGARGFVPDESKQQTVEGDERLLEAMCAHTHHYPMHWQGHAKTLQIRDEVAELFQSKVQIFMMEVLSVVLTPAVLCFSLPSCAPVILNFIQDHTAYVEGIGAVCDYSLFDFERYGDENYCAPTNGYHDAKEKAAHGKLEKSFMNFQNAHPNYEHGVGNSTSRMNVVGGRVPGSGSLNPLHSMNTGGDGGAAGALSNNNNNNSSSMSRQHLVASDMRGRLSAFRDLKERQQQQQLVNSIFRTQQSMHRVDSGLPAHSQHMPHQQQHQHQHQHPTFTADGGSYKANSNQILECNTEDDDTSPVSSTHRSIVASINSSPVTPPEHHLHKQRQQQHPHNNNNNHSHGKSEGDVSASPEGVFATSELPHNSEGDSNSNSNASGDDYSPIVAPISAHAPAANTADSSTPPPAAADTTTATTATVTAATNNVGGAVPPSSPPPFPMVSSGHVDNISNGDSTGTGTGLSLRNPRSVNTADMDTGPLLSSGGPFSRRSKPPTIHTGKSGAGGSIRRQYTTNQQSSQPVSPDRVINRNNNNSNNHSGFRSRQVMSPRSSGGPRIEMSYLSSQHNGGGTMNSPSSFTPGSRNRNFSNASLLESAINNNINNNSNNINSRFSRGGYGSSSLLNHQRSHLSSVGVLPRSDSEAKISSVLLSMMQQENMADYSNDFFWLARFQHERARNPKALDDSLMRHSQTFLEGSGGVDNSSGLGGFSAAAAGPGEMVGSGMSLPFSGNSYFGPNGGGSSSNKNNNTNTNTNTSAAGLASSSASEGGGGGGGILNYNINSPIGEGYRNVGSSSSGAGGGVFYDQTPAGFGPLPTTTNPGVYYNNSSRHVGSGGYVPPLAPGTSSSSSSAAAATHGGGGGSYFPPPPAFRGRALSGGAQALDCLDENDGGDDDH